MQVGIDSFAVHPLELAPAAQLEWAKANGFDGVQFGGVAGLTTDRDPGPLRALRAEADALGLYTHVGVGGCNPHFTGQPPGDLATALRAHVALAAAAGWHELHGLLGGPRERFDLPVPFARQLDDSAAVLADVAPVLRAHGSRINLETHADATTFELVRLVERVGPDVLGICLDTANVVLHGEHPTRAARRAAPYVHMVHLKDCILWPVPEGLRRQTCPPGQGVIDWPAVLGALRATSPDLPLSIEDHKWLFDAAVFDDRWHALHPDLPRDELAAVFGLACACHRQILDGTRPDPAAVEAVDYAIDMHDRLTAGRTYLRGLDAPRRR